jgi:hypothetical protein
MRFGFSPFGFIIAMLQLLPNIIWALFPPERNILKGNTSSVPFIEYGEHILGVSIVIMLMFLVNQTQKKIVTAGLVTKASLALIGLYWLCWVFYFCEIQPLPVIYAMVVLPPLAFFLAGIAKKVYLIAAVSFIFLGFHLTVALENYPV